MIERLTLPEYLLRSAFVVGNGERLWPARAALAVIDWLAAHEVGILGGEVYERREFGWGRYVSDWVTRPDPAPTELWHAYVLRGRSQAWAAVTAANDVSDLESTATRLYFLAWTSHAEFGQVRRLHNAAATHDSGFSSFGLPVSSTRQGLRTRDDPRG